LGSGARRVGERWSRQSSLITDGSLSHTSIDLTMVASPFAAKSKAMLCAQACVGIERGKAWSLHRDVKVGCFYPFICFKIISIL
jgi:hypothetical protein